MRLRTPSVRGEKQKESEPTEPLPIRTVALLTVKSTKVPCTVDETARRSQIRWFHSDSDIRWTEGIAGVGHKDEDKDPGFEKIGEDLERRL